MVESKDVSRKMGSIRLQEHQDLSYADTLLMCKTPSGAQAHVIELHFVSRLLNGAVIHGRGKHFL